MSASPDASAPAPQAISRAAPAAEAVVARAPEGAAPRVLAARSHLWWFGPAFVASIAYVDPGNFGTNISAGAAFGYALLWVLLWSNAMAVLIQYLSAKLGIVTGRTLPENCRLVFPRPVTIVLWLAAEAAALATDLAEVLGGALGLHLLFGWPVWLGALATGALVFAILALERAGFRKLEAALAGFVGIIGMAYAVELVVARPDWGGVAAGVLRPALDGSSAYAAAGMLGATVMPHVAYLHSALVLPRRRLLGEGRVEEHLRRETADIACAMNAAWVINSAMVIMAAGTFFRHGIPVASLEEAYGTLVPLLGPAAAVTFGLALVASGLASAAVGTMAGDVIMAGFLQLRVSPFLRRLATLLPALAYAASGADVLRGLVLSQVVLSFALPFVLVPLLWLTASGRIMGRYRNRPWTNALGAVVVGLVVGLDLYLLGREVLLPAAADPR